MSRSLRSRTAIGVVAGLAWLMLFSLRIAAAHLGGDECVALGGTVVANECLITTAVSRSGAAHGGAFTIGETLHITGSGSIVVPAASGGNTLTLDITGDLVIDLPTVNGGGRIAGDVTTATGIGAAIAVTATGDILLHGNGSKGARISSDQLTGSCSGGHGGNITLAAGGAFKSDAGSIISSTAVCGGGEIIVTAAEPSTVGGIISSEGTTSVGRGGPITVTVACDLTVGDAGKIVSKGRDPGADRVHLEAGCGVVINGLVASTGPGHLIQNQNRCNAPDRPDKPSNAPGCVEVWSGGPLSINSGAPHNGEVSADTGQSGGVACCAWIDLFAAGDIRIHGDTGGLFAVHANQTLTNGFGGLITVKSIEGNVSATGLAIQAEDQAAGGRGGIVTVEAALAVTLDDAQIFARGDLNSAGGFGQGGKIGARAYNGPLSWNNPGGGVVATGDVRATGSQVPVSLRGTIGLTGCGSVTTAGTLFPANGTATTPSAPTFACGGGPVLESYVTLPACICSIPSADVGVTMTANPPAITAGDPAQYTIVVTSDGADPATGVTLTDHVPAGLTWTAGGPDGGACSISAGVLSCSFGTMPPGSTKTVTLTAPTTLANCGTLSNAAMVGADQDSLASNDNTGPVTITVACPNVGVTMTTSTPTINAGANASYAVVVTGGGTGSSTDVVLKDTLPAGLTWAVTGADAAACSIAGGIMTCSFGTVAQGAAKTITLTAPTTTANCGTISNTATVSAAIDSSTSNNSAGPVLIAVKCADVGVTLTTSTPTVTVGGIARYAVGVTAGGTGASTNVVLQETLPPGMTWTASGAGAASCSIAAGTLTCNFGTMTQGSTKSVNLAATTGSANCGQISSTASVSAAADGNPGNNSAGPVTITIVCPDVSVTKSATTPIITAGGTARYTISVTAGGAAPSTSVVLKDNVPAGLVWTVGGANAGSCSIAAGLLTCNFGTMAAGSTKTITLSAVTSAAQCASGGVITNTARVTAALDVDATNNTTPPSIISVTCPDVSIVKTTSTPVVVAGMSASYGITVTAGGTGTSTNVVLSDSLPSGLSWTVSGADAASCAPASPVAGGTTLTCSFGSMAAGTAKTIALTATTSTANCPSIVNTASVSATGDTGSTNNSSGPITITVNAPAASSTAFGESIALNVLPLLGAGVNLASGPQPMATGSAPPSYDATDSVASAALSSLLTGQVLGTGLIVANASSNFLAGNNASADATVNGLELNVGLALLQLLHVGATVVQSTASLSGPCGALTSAGTTTLLGLSVTALGLPPLVIPVNPLPNTVLVNALGIRIVLNEQIAGGDGVTGRSLTVNAIHIYLENAQFGAIPLGAVVNGDIVIASSHAEQDCLSGGQCACQLAPPASSAAFGETVGLHLLPVLGNGLLIHSGQLPAVSGSAPAPYNKTSSTASANVSTALTGSIVQTGVITVHASSNLTPGTDAAADATVNGLNVDVVGLLQVLGIDATVVQSTADVAGACGSLAATGTTTLVNASANVLTVGSLTIDAHPAPNTVLVDLPALGIKIVLNEQVLSGDGATQLGLTVNAIHVYLVNVNIAGIGVLSGDIVIAQSRAQRNCAAGCS